MTTIPSLHLITCPQDYPLIHPLAVALKPLVLAGSISAIQLFRLDPNNTSALAQWVAKRPLHSWVIVPLVNTWLEQPTLLQPLLARHYAHEIRMLSLRLQAHKHDFDRDGITVLPPGTGTLTGEGLEQGIVLVRDGIERLLARSGSADKGYLAPIDHILPTRAGVPWARPRWAEMDEEEVLWLMETFRKQSQVTVAGAVGMGKRTLALEFFYRNKGRYHPIIWLDAQMSSLHRKEVCQQHAEQAGLATHAVESGLFQAWWRKQAQGVLVLEGLHNPMEVHSLLPLDGQPRVLWLTAQSKQADYMLNSWTEQRMYQYYKRVVGRKVGPDAKKLLLQLQGWPLALAVVCACIQTFRLVPGRVLLQWPEKDQPLRRQLQQWVCQILAQHAPFLAASLCGDNPIPSHLWPEEVVKQADALCLIKRDTQGKPRLVL
ncbi:hypothetical protein [Magnetococcus sp. PR-3]|uniref:hypothetical protein n=1 Tax=Magnetococcus sp. PR-3 TaxID=3120355 RepID=UPI002FCDEF97